MVLPVSVSGGKDKGPRPRGWLPDCSEDILSLLSLLYDRLSHKAFVNCVSERWRDCGKRKKGKDLNLGENKLYRVKSYKKTPSKLLLQYLFQNCQPVHLSLQSM